MNRKRMDEGRLLEEILPAFAKSADYTHTLMFVRVCLFSLSIDIFIFLFYGAQCKVHACSCLKSAWILPYEFRVL